MLVENSMFVADFFGGFYLVMIWLTLASAIAAYFVFLFASIEKKPRAYWWLIPIGLELLFALWFFCTFSIKG